MHSKKLRNISYSLILLAVWTSIILLLSIRPNSNPGDISAFYFWAKFTSLVVGFGALLLIGLRIFNIVDKNRSFLYCFLGTANLALGFCGIGFYWLRKINMNGLHDLLPNLLIGVIILADIFLFELISQNKTK